MSAHRASVRRAVRARRCRCGQAGHEPFTADPARDFPEPDERALDDGRVALRAGRRDWTRTRRRRMVQEGERIFAMIAGGRDELIENAPLFRRRSR